MPRPAFTAEDLALLDWANSDDEDWVRELHGDYALWLIEGSPDDWHQAGMQWNWDTGIAPIVWIIRQPECDIATAIELLHIADPYFKAQYGSDPAKAPPIIRDTAMLCAEIAERLRSGFYRRSEIAVNHAYPHDFTDPALTFYLPREACIRVDGRIVPAGEYGNGIPMALNRAPYVSKYDRDDAG